MFRAVAVSGHQKRCIDALDTYISMMDYENPPVELDGEVARSVMECLMVIEPGIDRNELDDNRNMGKWARVWNTALEGLKKTQTISGVDSTSDISALT